MTREPSVFIEHILESIDFIEKYAEEKTEVDFSRDTQLQDAVLHRLTIIGEAVKNVPDAVKKKNSDIPWRKIAGIKDVLVHHYFGIDLGAIWMVVQKDIPELKAKLHVMKDAGV